MFTKFINCQPNEMLRGYARRVSPFRLAGILSLAIIVPSLGCSRKLPDLSACTRIEVHYRDGALDYFIPSTDAQNSLLNEDERRLVK
jgi:hypothetical protein